MIQAAHDTNGTPPELGPIFGYLHAHANKLYQEGYFLKLHDLDSRELALTPVLPKRPENNIMQVAAPARIECGMSALRNWSAQSCPCGTQHNWMPLVRMERSFRHLST